MRITEFMNCDKDCVYQKDGFCVFSEKRGCDEEAYRSQSFVQSNECKYYESKNDNKKSDSRLEAYFI